MKESNIECNHCRNMYDSRSYCTVCAGAYKRKESDNIYGNKKSPTFSKKYFHFQNNNKKTCHSHRKHQTQCHHCHRWNITGRICSCRQTSELLFPTVILKDHHHHHHG
ncbi:Hypothetical protein SRAE_2000431200 [Strongyloides ratti]|uniref:Uncharacterized protein n=1 Tax=Strongyloides ratti TaxID=34506 RepID=A0A090MZW9_STRRB|nr:Hypothetical protein SRAE_2000431200 [Strongyloides ratti]CEF69665.1 Hypothetical protein SRAE_2000431200 [Strongyloides ratti]